MWKKKTNIDDVADLLTESSIVPPKNSLKEHEVDDEVDEINKLLTSNQLSNWEEAVFLASGERLVGSLNTGNEVYLYGKVEGESLETKKDFFIHSTGQVLSSIKANRILTGGTIKGSMVVNEVACFLDTSLIEGDVLTKKIIINNGAQFKGTIETHEQVTLNHDDKEKSECFHLKFAENHKKIANYKLNIIGNSTVVDGELHCQERNLLCFGKVNGKINAPNKVVFIASGAEINGEINCKRLHVSGTVLGNVEVSGLISCGSNSTMNAKVIAKSFMLKEGANYEGQVYLGGAKDELNQQCHDNQENKVQEDIKENSNDSVINIYK